MRAAFKKGKINQDSWFKLYRLWTDFEVLRWTRTDGAGEEANVRGTIAVRK